MIYRGGGGGGIDIFWNQTIITASSIYYPKVYQEVNSAYSKPSNGVQKRSSHYATQKVYKLEKIP